MQAGHSLVLFSFLLWPYLVACSVLVPQPGLNPRPGSENTESQLLDHQEFPER